ncbi:MAG: 3-hydroxyacyl-CoA dehydrogenase family protein [Pirellulaceae bacterium]
MSMPIGVVGMGLLGRGIAACFLESGYQVVAVARTADRHAMALPIIEQMIGELVQHRVAPPELLDQWRPRLSQVTTWEPLASCRFVVESVYDDLAVKQSVFDEIERVVGDEVVIASNTSAIPINVLQQTRRIPQRFVGMHWAEPAHATRFLELIRGKATSDETVRRTEELARRLGKDPTVCRKDIPGFIVNRIGYAMYREALNLVELGVADIETIDRSVRNTLGVWAASCGPFRWIDLTGGPALYGRAMERVIPTLRTDEALPPLLATLVQQDARGIANGRGFYEYTPQETQTWEERQRRHAWLVKEWLDAEFPLASASQQDGLPMSQP